MRDDLPHAMRETARRLEPDVGRLTAGAVSRGTRMRRLERAAQVLGSAVAVAVVLAGVTIGSHRGAGTGGDQRETNQPAASGGDKAPESGPAATTPAATPPRTAANPTLPSPTATAQITQSQLVTALKKSLAGTGVSGLSFTAVGTDSPPTTTVAVRPAILVDAQLTTAKNVGFLSIVFSAPRDLTPRSGTPKPLSDGSVVYSSQGAGSSDGRHPDRADLQVILVRPDGSSLAAFETNATTPKGAAAYPDAPLLLSADQLATLLGSPVWDGALAAAATLPPADGAALVPTTSPTPLSTSSTPSSSSSP